MARSRARARRTRRPRSVRPGRRRRIPVDHLSHGGGLGRASRCPPKAGDRDPKSTRPLKRTAATPAAAAAGAQRAAISHHAGAVARAVSRAPRSMIAPSSRERSPAPAAAPTTRPRGAAARDQGTGPGPYALVILIESLLEGRQPLPQRAPPPMQVPPDRAGIEPQHFPISAPEKPSRSKSWTIKRCRSGSSASAPSTVSARSDLLRVHRGIGRSRAPFRLERIGGSAGQRLPQVETAGPDDAIKPRPERPGTIERAKLARAVRNASWTRSSASCRLPSSRYATLLAGWRYRRTSGAKASASPPSTRSTSAASAAMSSRGPGPLRGAHQPPTRKPPATRMYTPGRRERWPNGETGPGRSIQSSPLWCDPASRRRIRVAAPGLSLRQRRGSIRRRPGAFELYRILTPMRQVPLAVALGTLFLAPGTAGAQARSITLADAIRLSERVQPGVVRAPGRRDDRRRPAAECLGTPTFPSVTASSSASDFF